MDFAAFLNTENKIILIVAALLPAILLCWYVFKKDKVDKEPIGLLLLLLGAGAVSCFPAAYLETFLDGILTDVMYPYMVFDNMGAFVGFKTSLHANIYYAIMAFVEVALVEEGFKLLFLVLITRKNKNFNSLFDGLIYSIFVSLGFAALENVLYVLENGMGNAIMRAILSVPGHMFFAVIMGYYYSLSHMYSKAGLYEKSFKERGLISKDIKVYSGTGYMFLGLLMATLAHGFYDFCCFTGSTLMTIVLIVFVIFLYIYCFGKIRKMSKNDVHDSAYLRMLLEKKHPGIIEALARERAENMKKAENPEE